MLPRAVSSTDLLTRMNPLTVFGPATSGSRVSLSSSVPPVWEALVGTLLKGPCWSSFVLPCRAVPLGRWLWSWGLWFPLCADTCFYISCSLDQLGAAKQFIQWLMKMEIWIKAYLSRRGWGNACRRNQLLHFCLAEDVVLAPPSRNSILWCFLNILFLWFCFVFYILNIFWS